MIGYLLLSPILINFLHILSNLLMNKPLQRHTQLHDLSGCDDLPPSAYGALQLPRRLGLLRQLTHIHGGIILRGFQTLPAQVVAAGECKGTSLSR